MKLMKLMTTSTKEKGQASIVDIGKELANSENHPTGHAEAIQEETH